MRVDLRRHHEYSGLIARHISRAEAGVNVERVMHCSAFISDPKIPPLKKRAGLRVQFPTESLKMRLGINNPPEQSAGQVQSSQTTASQAQQHQCHEANEIIHESALNQAKRCQSIPATFSPCF
jgi:hypothetical protein